MFQQVITTHAKQRGCLGRVGRDAGAMAATRRLEESTVEVAAIEN